MSDVPPRRGSPRSGPSGPSGALRSAWGLLTVLGGASPPHPGAAGAYGIVGGILGGIVGIAWWAFDGRFPALVAAALVVALDAGLTGMLHLDGLADCGDGLIAPMERARRLAVMRAPDVGAFGLVVVAITLALRVAGLASIEADPWLLIALWSASRAAMAALPAALVYARAEGGLASQYAGRGAHLLGAGLGAVVAAVAAAMSGRAAWVGLAGAAIGAVAVAALARRRLGGYTGDVLGAVVVVAETAGLVAASARW
ncbi:MAG: adenosylcobinamide-GDP ribazoletransferase [Acidimicrobiales bacterium]|nr:adenosylcobinamide-GDP ribazoletransferase [Acidimicrobiales bacterium]